MTVSKLILIRYSRRDSRLLPDLWQHSGAYPGFLDAGITFDHLLVITLMVTGVNLGF